MDKLRAYFPFYPADWLLDPVVQRMTLEQQGAYVRLLCASWRDGPLPTDPAELAVIVGVTPRRFENHIWPAIESCWRPSGGGIVNRRLEHERSEAKRMFTARSLGGKKTAEKRWGAGSASHTKSSSSSSAIAQQVGEQPDSNRYSPSPSPSPSPEVREVDEPDGSSTLPQWPENLSDVRAELDRLGVLDRFDDPTYWRRIDDWLKHSGVGYLDELAAYLAWLEAQPISKQHKNIRRGFRNWLAKAAVWEDQRGQKEEFRQRRQFEK